MMPDPAPRPYRPAVRALHWIVAALIVAMIPAGQIMTRDGLPRGLQDALFLFHKNVGVVLLILMLVRLGIRLRHPPPPLPAHVPPWQARAAGAVHGALYALVILMAVSGYIRVRAGGFPIESLDALGLPGLVPRSDALAETASRIHALTRIVLILLILAHIGAALQHAARRDGVLSRMWPGSGR